MKKTEWIVILLLVGVGTYLWLNDLTPHQLSTEELKAKALELVQQSTSKAHLTNIKIGALVHTSGNLYEGYADVMEEDSKWGTQKPAQFWFDLIYDKESLMLKPKGLKEAE